jgi:hypothetical protein
MPISYINNNSLASGVPGTSKLPAGSVLQVVSATKTDTFSTGSQSPNWVDITGLSVNITPTNSSNRIFIQAYISIGSSAAQLQYFRIVRNSTAICIGDAAGSRVQSTFAWYYGNGDTTSHIGAIPITFVDSPATTSATTYKVQMCTQNSGGTSYVNRNNADSDSVIFGTRTASTITVMEIAA